ncbi:MULTISPECIES: CaiB/BaiF CoA transferase family protein [Variovorax]|jgi:formyl-CoA transferase|uniref:CaiB/BaiF CoA-transferase family protein n=1 Tax=Variovorax ginsengisoli TaxID=363844 RepID=A0ABT8RXW4_9BURK|nr:MULTISPECIES: CaiB/BaiF CoA-transferase family protein [Variovorax]MDM0082981.1 CaiB/BaiF CoA-transferase family protein [Variovorax sp. J31P179]MDN8612339.1 CaiB/BaiF CoA-transferase family protein [Variovorax ginsengisoli]MDO1531509.1 CaiB/BaiF CoA-transferase family protein [Variovorax ginsengisoli]HET7837644.1 CaiB/BaiF CoA-transferase family protein [Variovorax sp.]
MSAPAATQGALAGLKVLDLSRVLAGPWCTQILADLGADVIKIERPGVGDDTRGWGPPFLKDADGNDTHQATYFTACNRNKRSVTIDMATPDGQALLKRMAAESDILVENFKTGGLKQYGLDHESLRAANPRLIYCSVTGFGHDGPHAMRAGYDLMIQATTGMMSITGRPDDVPGGGPLRVGVALTDLFTGVYASTAILAAIEVRHRTGEGQHIDMALLDVGMAILANQASAFLNTGVAPQRQGNSHPSLAPYQDFRTADGAMLLAIGNNGQFARFCEAAGHPEWAADPRFATNTLRVRHREVLIPQMEAVTRTRSTAQWIALLEDKAVPCGPINDIAQAFEDDQVKARGLAVTLPRDAGDGIEQIVGVASPLRLQSTPPVLRRAPPALGQHTDEVLAEFGIDEARRAALRAAGVV